MKNAIVVYLSLVACLIFGAQNAHATKTAPPLPIQVTATATSVAPGAAVNFNVMIANKTSSSYWGVTATVSFPATLSCTHIVSQTGGCSFANNTLSCYWADYYDWWVAQAQVACTVAAAAPCGSQIKSVANLNVNKPSQTNAAEANITVACANQPKTECNDGIDNDGDGRIDLNDSDCTDANDPSERGVVINVPQCRDGVDNDGDGKVDALLESGAGNGGGQATIANGDPQSYIPAFNARGAGTIQDAALFDQPTAQKICQVMGYTTVVSFDSRHNDGRNGFTSPGNNTLSRWNPATNSFEYLNAKAAGNRWIATLVCSGTPSECSNGRDDDSDGASDFPADSGCASANDGSERPHDPGCTNPDDNDERDSLTQCQDSLDNDGDGRIDFPQDLGCSSPSDNFEGDEPACQDGRDNDGDGRIDFPTDPGCSGPTDTTENDDPQCSDQRDNDGDGRVDMADPGCDSPTDTNEGDEPACKDGRDNDGDGKTDFPADPGCLSPNDSDENGEPECADGRDNDGDGWIDFPEDGGCSSKSDNSERDPNGPQCDNGIDDDADGRVDFPNDPECTGPKDTTEATQCSDKKDNDGDGNIDLQDPGCANPQDDNEADEPQCADRRDNDGDGKIDILDPGCKNPTDNDESDDPKPQCADGKDNDSDGKIDYPADPGCLTATDDNEGDDPKTQCSDKIDNDHDGWIDYPEDSGCASSEDNDEANAVNPITPTVSCIFDNGDGTSTGFFGYENSSAQSVSVAAGSNDRLNINAFTPGDPNQGQPNVFKTGRNAGVFSAVFSNSSSLTWTVMVNGSGKNSVTAKKGQSRDCSPVLPILECVDQKSSSQYVARYGYENQNDFEVPIAIGQYNQFSPGVEDRGQPNKFFKGLVKSAFTVDLAGSELTWKLAGQAVTANQQSKSCNPNTAPVCNAGGPYAKTCQGSETKIALDGTASKDPEGKALTYKWSTNCKNISIDSATAVTPTITLTGPGLGDAADCSMTLTVSDGILTSSCQAPVQVPACSMDCNNKPGGSAQIDQCGVCGGNGSTCLGCDGKPNSGAVPDKCGVCGGTNACLGCDGVPNSGTVNDACGVCGGNGQSCQQCTESDIKQTLFSMDASSLKMKANALQILRRLERQAKDEKTKQLAEQGKTEAAKIAAAMWEKTWSLPQTIKTCAESSACSTSDNSISINEYNASSGSLHDLAQRALRELARVLGGELRTDDKKLGIAADRLYEESVATSATVPRFQSVCN